MRRPNLYRGSSGDCIDVFQDAYDAAFWKTFAPKEMEIFFLPQCREREELTILSRKEEGAVYVAAVHTDG